MGSMVFMGVFVYSIALSSHGHLLNTEAKLSRFYGDAWASF